MSATRSPEKLQRQVQNQSYTARPLQQADKVFYYSAVKRLDLCRCDVSDRDTSLYAHRLLIRTEVQEGEMEAFS